MTVIDEIENEARADYACGHGRAQRAIGTECHIIECTIVSAMVNRGNHTGDVKRATWRINGSRASRGAVDRIAAL